MHILYCEGRVLKFSGKRQQPNLPTYLLTYLYLGLHLRPPVLEVNALQFELSLQVNKGALL